MMISQLKQNDLDFPLTVVLMMLILLTWCEFQKYALTSLQQLLADHPPAPEGLDPDIGTVVNKHLCLFCFFVCLLFPLSFGGTKS